MLMSLVSQCIDFFLSVSENKNKINKERKSRKSSSPELNKPVPNNPVILLVLSYLSNLTFYHDSFTSCTSFKV